MKNNDDIIIFDESCTYSLPLLKEGLDKMYDAEETVSGVTLHQKNGIVTLSKEGYNSKTFYDRGFEWMLHIGYVRKDV